MSDDQPTPDDITPNDIARDDVARRRFFTMQAVRIGGLVLLLTGILALNGWLALPPLAGYGLAVIGLVLFAAMPIVLARRWRSSRP